MTDTNPMETAFDAFSELADVSEAKSTKTLQMEALKEFNLWLRANPAAVLSDLIEQLKRARQTGELSTNPLAGFMALFAASSTNGSAPIAALGSGVTDAIAAPTHDTEAAPALSAREASMLDVFRTFIPADQTWWEELIRDFTALSSDEKMGATNAFEAIAQRRLSVTKMGRPLSEKENDRLTTENENQATRIKALEAEISKLKGEKTELEGKVSTLKGEKTELEKDLEAAKKAAPKSTPAATTDAAHTAFVDSARMMVERIYRELYARGIPNPKGNLRDEATLKNLLEGQVPTDIESVIKTLVGQVTDYYNAAVGARRNLMLVSAVNKGTSLRPKLEPKGRQAVDTELKKITGEMTVAEITGSATV